MKDTSKKTRAGSIPIITALIAGVALLTGGAYSYLRRFVPNGPIQNPPVVASTTQNTPINPTSTEAPIIKIASTSMATKASSNARISPPSVPMKSVTQAPHQTNIQSVVIPTTAIPPVANTAPIQARSPITTPLASQQMLASATVAIICVSPQQSVYDGTGVILNSHGYLITNGHVVGDAEACYLARKRALPPSADNYPSGLPSPTIAIYYSLQLIGEGNPGVQHPVLQDWIDSGHDFAIFKIGSKLPRAEWQSDQASLDIATLNKTDIPWATDAEYAAFSPSGTYPAIGIDFDYQPVSGDLLSMDDFIGDTGSPFYSFSAGTVGSVTSSTIGVTMPTQQGFSGSPIVDNMGNLVGLSFNLDCGSEDTSCYTAKGFRHSVDFMYGSNGLALSIPFLDQAMKTDLGFDLHDLIVRQ